MVRIKRHRDYDVQELTYVPFEIKEKLNDSCVCVPVICFRCEE